MRKEAATIDLSATTLKLNNLQWPTADGSPNQVLKTSGAGVLSFATVSGGSGGGPWTDGPGQNSAKSTNASSTTIPADSTGYYNLAWGDYVKTGMPYEAAFGAGRYDAGDGKMLLSQFSRVIFHRTTFDTGTNAIGTIKLPNEKMAALVILKAIGQEDETLGVTAHSRIFFAFARGADVGGYPRYASVTSYMTDINYYGGSPYIHSLSYGTQYAFDTQFASGMYTTNWKVDMDSVAGAIFSVVGAPTTSRWTLLAEILMVENYVSPPSASSGDGSS